MKIGLTINGNRYEKEIPADRTLLDAIRSDFGLKGAKAYCRSGVCGACTVLIDGKPVSSCLMLVAQAKDKSVDTVEGMADGTNLHPVQRAFVENFGFQCGYCTPGMLLLTQALLQENPEPSKQEIIDYLGGNICRCTGYARILESVQAAAKMTKEASK